MKISDREKNLLYLLLVVCIIVGGFKLMLEPMINKIDSNTTTYSGLEDEKTSITLQESQLEVLMSTYGDNETTLEEYEEMIGAYMQDEELERMVSELLSAHNLGLEVLSMSQSSVQISEEVTDITAKEVKVSTYGSTSDFIAFVEELYEREDILIVSVSADTKDSTSTTYENRYGKAIEGSYIIEFKLYMNIE